MRATRSLLAACWALATGPSLLPGQTSFVMQGGGGSSAGMGSPGLVAYLTFFNADFARGDTLFVRGLLLNSADTVVHLTASSCEIRAGGIPTLSRSGTRCNPSESALAPGDSLVAEADFVVRGSPPPGTYSLSIAWAEIEARYPAVLRTSIPVKPERPWVSSPPRKPIPILLLAEVDTASGLSTAAVLSVVMMAGGETRSMPYLIAPRLPALQPELNYLWFHVRYTAEGDHIIEVGSARGELDPAHPRLNCRHIHKGRVKPSVFSEILRLDAALALQNFAEQRCLP